jgi:hypothetical protein
VGVFKKSLWMELANNANSAGASSGPPLSLGLFTGGTKLVYAPAAGASNNVNPGGAWPSSAIGRIDVDTTAGACNFTGLVAALTDGQGVMIRVTGANNLTLNSLNGGSSAANKFAFTADLVLPQNSTAILVYDLTLALWVIG